MTPSLREGMSLTWTVPSYPDIYIHFLIFFADGRETNKKRTTLARLLRGLKTVNRRDRTSSHQNSTATQLRVSIIVIKIRIITITMQKWNKESFFAIKVWEKNHFSHTNTHTPDSSKSVSLIFPPAWCWKSGKSKQLRMCACNKRLMSTWYLCVHFLLF